MMKNVHELLRHASDIEAELHYHFHDPNHLFLAFVHRSYLNEHQDAIEHNERLEYLGDAVLGLLVTEYLYRKHPHTDEGALSSLRSVLIDSHACTQFMEKLDLEKYILLGKGEKKNWTKGRESILADLFEAVIGAVFLDGGIEAARAFFFDNFGEDIEHIIKAPSQNWKALLQDHCQREFQQVPNYEILSEEGPDHEKMFLIAVSVESNTLGQGTGSSKKEAQQAAAQNAISKLENPSHGD